MGPFHYRQWLLRLETVPRSDLANRHVIGQLRVSRRHLRTSAALPLRIALLVERGDALTPVLRGRCSPPGQILQLEAMLERDLGPSVDGPLRLAHADRRGTADLPRQLHGGWLEGLAFDHPG